MTNPNFFEKSKYLMHKTESLVNQHEGSLEDLISLTIASASEEKLRLFQGLPEANAEAHPIDFILAS